MRYVSYLRQHSRRVLHDPALFFACVTGLLALGMVFFLPPFQAPDEHTHFFKAAELSEGKLIGHAYGPKTGYPTPLIGDELPARYKITADHYIALRINIMQKADTAQIKHDLLHPTTQSKRIPTPFENTVVYPPLAYTPQAIAIAVVNIFVKNPLTQLYAARIASLVVAIVLLYFAIKRMPFGKWAVVALASTPLSILLLASCAGDAITYGLSALFIATVLDLALGAKQLVRRDIVLLVVLAALLGLCKSPYQLLVLFGLAIPLRNFAERKAYLKTMVSMLIIPFILACTCAVMVHKLYLNVAPGSDSSVQAHFVATHPWGYVHALIQTYLGDAGDYVTRDYIDLSAGPAANMPLWFIVLNYCFVAAIILQLQLSTATRRLLKRVRALSAALFIIGAIIVNLLLYITFTPVRATHIDGLQGRYFMPLALLLIPAVGGMLATDRKRYDRLLISFRYFVLLTAVMSVYVMTKRYY